MTTNFRTLYDNPPAGQIQNTTTSTTAKASLTHNLGADLIPNLVVDFHFLADSLIAWARSYLNNVNQQPTQQLLNAVPWVSSLFDRAEAGNEGSVVSIYAATVEAWSKVFVEGADQLPLGTIRFHECSPASGVRSDWMWSRNGESRMIVEHKGRKVFDSHCDAIRALATASNLMGNGSPIGLDGSGHATGARAILIKLGRQMIADNCQLSLLFGGQRFMVFAMQDHELHDGQVRHVMHCSRILDTTSSAGHPDAIQVSIAALLGNKDAFFTWISWRVGFRTGTRDTRRTMRSHGNKGSKPEAVSGKQPAAGTVQRKSTSTRQRPLPDISLVAMSYSHARDTEFVFKNTDAVASNGEEDKSAAKLILYNPIGSGASGDVFDASLQLNSLTWHVAAKFYDPKVLIDGEDNTYVSEDDMSEVMFRNEVEAYTRLSDSSIRVPFYGAFRGIGFTGFETGLILLEQLCDTFAKLSDMNSLERETAYNHVLELHECGIHHGDVEPRNFGWISESGATTSKTEAKETNGKETGDGPRHDKFSFVVYDFSHSSVFDECDPEQCSELRLARDCLIDGRE